MGERDYYRKDYLKEKGMFTPGFDNAIVSLVIFNLIVFTILFGLHLIYLVVYDTAAVADPVFESDIEAALNLPADPSGFIYRPWTLLSYMVSHFSFWRLLSNMLWLWGFGYILQTVAGSNRVIPAFIYSGLSAAVFFLCSWYLFDRNLAPQMSGAAAAIVGMSVAATAISPDYRIFPMLGNGIPLWILTAVFLVLDLGTVSISLNLLVAHLAAGVSGYLFAFLIKKGNDPGAWMYRLAAKLADLFNPEKKYAGRERQTLYYKTGKQPYTKKPNLTQQKLDEILDKINQRGYDTLTEEEKAFLKKASEQL
ncbi:MAG TPA: rhomboid family intramembrane serine protease [Chitinophagaceae bacterium]